MKDNKNEVIKKFQEGTKCLDSHSGSGSDMSEFKLDAIIQFNSDNQQLAGFTNGANYQSLNAVRYNETLGALVLSQWSIGRVIEGRELTKSAVEEYNRSVGCDTQKIANVIFRDGTVWDFKCAS